MVTQRVYDDSDCDVSYAVIRPDIACAWRGPSLLIVNARGECGEGEPLSGFYFRETRYLSELRLEIDGQPPWPCAAGASSQEELTFVFTHPELSLGGAGGTGTSQDEVERDTRGVPRRALDLLLRYRVRVHSLDVTLTLTNREQEWVEGEVSWRLGADYADLQEALSGTRSQLARVATCAEQHGARFCYLHPELPLETHVSASGPVHWSATSHRLAARVALAPQERVDLQLRVIAIDASDMSDERSVEARERRLREWQESVTTVDAPGEGVFAAMVNQALSDLGSLALLEGSEEEWLTPAAGIPHYPALFGRDAVTSCWQAAALDRGQLLDASLTRLERLQGTRVDPERDEEPGRIVQQARSGPLARLRQNPFARYYGDFASPLMFVVAIGQLYAWTGERGSIARHWDAARRALDWAREYGDRDGDGYLEYLTRAARGPTHQGWKDSGRAVLYEDGRPVPTPVAPCEVQGYWFAAQEIMAVLSWVMDAREDAKAYWSAAMQLKERFNRDFWMEHEGFIALALDPDKRPVRSIASNAGHCLASGIVSDDHIPALVGRLFAPDLFSGWGIRTLSSEHPAYSPLSYHLGSVWTVENATIAFGLRRYGFDVRALELTRAIMDLALLYPQYRVPECVGGYARAELPHPGAYPRANALQAWNQSAFPLLTQTILGLQPVAALDLLVIDPVLPSWLPELTLRSLRLGGATVTIRFHRDADGRSHADVLRKHGTLHVVRQPPLESLKAGIGDRLRALVEGVMHG